MSAIDDYKKLRGEVLEQVELFEKHQKAIKLTSFDDYAARNHGLQSMLSDVVKSKAFRDLFRSEMNARLERAYQSAKREAEGFGGTMPATVESLQLEQVHAVAMSEGDTA